MSLQITSSGRVVVYSDGCLKSGNHYGRSKAGIGIFFSHKHPWNEALSTGAAHKTCNDIEMEAAQRAIDVAECHGYAVQLYTDSQFVVFNKNDLTSRSSRRPEVQRLDRTNEGICEAHKLANAGADN